MTRPRISVLALDLATVLGFAAWQPGMAIPHCDAKRLPGKPGEVGQSCAKLLDFLNEMHPKYRFTHVFFEAQHVSRKMDMNTIYKLCALGGVAELFCHHAKIPCFKVEIGEWRKHFIGRGTGFKSKNLDPKQMALDKCEQLGIYTDSTDAAEAVGILDYCLTMIPSVVAPWRDNDLLKAR